MKETEKENNKDIRTGTTPVLNDSEYWTYEEVEYLFCMYFEGKSITEISLALNRSESSVNQKIESYDCDELLDRQYYHYGESLRRCDGCPANRTLKCGIKVFL